jgi:hypothetical protein
MLKVINLIGYLLLFIGSAYFSLAFFFHVTWYMKIIYVVVVIIYASFWISDRSLKSKLDNARFNLMISDPVNSYIFYKKQEKFKHVKRR